MHLQSRVFKVTGVLEAPTANNTAALTFAEALAGQDVGYESLTDSAQGVTFCILCFICKTLRFKHSLVQ